MIDGVTLHPLRQITVPNGDLWHAFKSSDIGYAGFGEVYFTQIEPNKVKGWKRHNQYVLNLVVIIGCVKFVIYDDRLNSPTNGQFEEIILSPKNNYQRLTIASGLWVAFAGADMENTSILADLIPEIHDPKESDRKEIDDIKYDFNI